MNINRFIIVCAVVLLLSWIGVKAKELSLKAMSYNVRYTTSKDGENVWSNRKSMVASIIQLHDVDVVGLQESSKQHINYLKEYLEEYDHIGILNSIMFKKSRLEVVEHSSFWLSETPGKSSWGWDAQSKRLVRWIKFKDKNTGKIFYFFNSHFDYMGVISRKESALLLVRKIDEIARDMPVILVGDFNCGEGSCTYRILGSLSDPVQNALYDAYYISIKEHEGPVGTFTGFTDPSTPGKDVDFIFIKNNVRVLRHAVIDDAWGTRLPSDHRPVLSEVLIDFKPGKGDPARQSRIYYSINEILKTGTPLIKKQNFKIISGKTRIIKYTFNVSDNEQKIRRIVIGIGHCDTGLHYKLIDSENILTMSGYIRSKGVVWRSCEVPSASKWTLLLEKMDTAFKGKYSGNTSTIEVWLK